MKAIFILLYPIHILRKLTIPYYTEATWNRKTASIMPFFSIFFILYTQDCKLIFSI